MTEKRVYLTGKIKMGNREIFIPKCSNTYRL